MTDTSDLPSHVLSALSRWAELRPVSRGRMSMTKLLLYDWFSLTSKVDFSLALGCGV